MMPDFETMLIGTRQAIRETAELLRSYERHHQEQADKEGGFYDAERSMRQHKAKRNGDAAAKLEALLILPGVELPKSGTIPLSKAVLHNGSGVPGDDMPLDGQ